MRSADGHPTTPRMRVLHIGPTPFFSDRGCHIRIHGLIRALQRSGLECWLCTYQHGRDVEGIDTERIPRVPGYNHVDAGPSPFKYVADVMLFFKVCGSIARRRPDVLHGHLHEGALIGWAARTVFFWRRLPLVFDMQGSLTGELEAYGYFNRLQLLRWLFERAEWLIDRLPEHIVCSSPSSLEITRDRFGVPAGRLHLVADGVDVQAPSAASVDRLRDELGLPAGLPVIVYSGSLLAVKGVEALHAAILRSAERDLPVHFLVVGYPTSETAAFLRSRGLESRCTITGRVPFDTIGKYLALASAALEPKENDSGEASGKLLNYMAAGLPVACFDTPNNRIILADSGCYASSGSVDQLVDCIETLTTSPEVASELGERGRARARAEFSWDASAAALQRIYGAQRIEI